MNGKRTSFYDFIKESWDKVESCEYIDNWHVKVIADHLEAVTNGEINRLVISVPPGCGISTIACILWPAWEWTFAPEETTLFCSKHFALSERSSIRFRQLIDTSYYQNNFDISWELNSVSKRTVKNTRHGSRIASTVGEKVCSRYEKIVMDEVEEFGLGIHETLRIFDYYDDYLKYKLNTLEKSKFVIINKRLHIGDFVSQVLKKGGYEHLIIPAEYILFNFKPTSIDWNDPRTEKGQTFFSALYPKDTLDGYKKRIGKSAYSAIFNQDVLG